MQPAKDSFYLALRARLAALNPNRTLLLRGAIRPGIVVEEAEAPFAQLPPDVFVLRWQALAADLDGDPTLLAAACEILYQTCGTPAFGGLDRGRALTAMDTELLSLLQPPQTPKLDYATTPPTPLHTQVFWDDPLFTPIAITRDRLSRSARLTVYTYPAPPA